MISLETHSAVFLAVSTCLAEVAAMLSLRFLFLFRDGVRDSA